MLDEIRNAISEVTGLKPESIQLDVPERSEFGDYSSNIALELFSQGKNGKVKIREKNQLLTVSYSSPRELANEIVERLSGNQKLKTIVEKIEVAGPGFINFWISSVELANNIVEILKSGDRYGSSEKLKGKKILLEHTSPNTIKTLHVGHVRNNILGMAIHNLMEFMGANVTLDAINNDRGIHVMKAVWAYMKYGKNKTPEDEGLKPDHFVDRFYVLGVKAYDEDEKSKEEIRELLRKWEAKDEGVRSVWRKLRDWTFEGFRETYRRLGSYHDHQWFESDFYERAKEMIEEGLRKGVFQKLPDGAVLSNLKDYGLPDTIILRSDGTSMYHTQDLYLTKLKREKFPSELYIWDIGPEQELYLKQLFAMCEQLGIGERKDFMHLPYGFVYLKGGGKMSSRAGNVVSADDLIAEAVSKAKKIIQDSKTNRGLNKDEIEKVSEMVGLAAIKYGFLKVGRTTDIYFDIDESLSLEGNSGPYLQYTYARIRSIISKAKGEEKPVARRTKERYVIKQKIVIRAREPVRPSVAQVTYKYNKEELALLRAFIHFPEVIETSCETYFPNLLCNYLYDLAGKFNAFYNKHRVLDITTDSQKPKTEESMKAFRLILTSATGQILKTGLNLLGIQVPEKM